MIEVGNKSTQIYCQKCEKNYIIKLDESVLDVDKFPFPILVMHTVKREVHILIAYIDKNNMCRHVELLDGKRVFITPFILYNPDLLKVYLYN